MNYGKVSTLHHFDEAKQKWVVKVIDRRNEVVCDGFTIPEVTNHEFDTEEEAITFIEATVEA